eukprot:contig_1314_g196
MDAVHLGIALFRGRHTNKNILAWVRTRLQYYGLETDNPASSTTDSGTRKLWGHLNHSNHSISIYRGLDVQGKTEAREVITEVPTRWSSFYRALARWYTCDLRIWDLLIELHDRLSRAELLYFKERPGSDGLCVEAKQVVSILREQLDMRFFDQHDISRNLLKSTPVLMSTALSPGGSKLIKAVSKVMAVESMKEQAVLDIRGVCDRIFEPATAPLTNATPPAACAARTCRVYSALPEWTDNKESQGSSGLAESTKATLAKVQLDERMQAVATSKTNDPMEY